MGTVKIRLFFLVVKVWIKAIAMATSHLMTGRSIPHFGINSLIFFHTLPHHGNDIA